MNWSLPRVLVCALLVGSVDCPVLGRTVTFNLNVFPDTESWEVTATVDGDGKDQDGLAGYFFQLTNNVTWWEGTAPLVSDLPVGKAGFDLSVGASLGTHFEIVGAHGATRFTPDGEGILFDVGKIAGGEVPAGATGRNVPWSLPVVLAVGGYDSGLRAIEFTEGGDPPFADANVFVRDDDGSYVIIGVDGSIIGSGGSSPTFAMAVSTEADESFKFDGVPSSEGQSEDPLNLVFNRRSRPNVDGPQKGFVEQWLAEGAIPEPSTATLVTLMSGLLFIRRRRAQL